MIATTGSLYQPTTALVPGEMVYKIIGELDTNRVAEQIKLFSKIFDVQNILKMLFSIDINKESIAKSRTNTHFYRISTHLLGYVATRVEGGQGGFSENWALNGYNIEWHNKDGKVYYNFEDETLLLPLKDIIIIEPDSLYGELTNATKTR